METHCLGCGIELLKDCQDIGLCDYCLHKMVGEMYKEEQKRRYHYTCGLCGGRVMNGVCFACEAELPPQGDKKEIV